MADRIEFRALNGGEIADLLSQLPKRLGAYALKSAVQAGAVELGRVAKEMAPRQTGELRRGIKAFRRSTGSVLEARSTTEATAWYSRIVEKGHKVTKVPGYFPSAERRWKLSTRQRIFGTKKRASKMPQIGTARAKPFLRPAFDTGRTRVVNAIERQLVKGILRGFAKTGQIPSLSAFSGGD